MPIGLAVISTAALTGTLAFSISRFHAANTATLLVSLPSEGQARILLAGIGLDAEALAAAGATAAQTSAAVGAVRDHLEEHWDAIQQAEWATDSARRTRDALQRRVRQGVATTEERTALATAESDLVQAESQHQAALDAAFAAGTESLSQAQRTVLLAIRGNRAKELPVQYLAGSRSEEGWMQLRDALASRKAAQRFGEELAAEAAQVLLQADSASETATALANLQANGAAVASAWEAALAQ